MNPKHYGMQIEASEAFPHEPTQEDWAEYALYCAEQEYGEANRELSQKSPPLVEEFRHAESIHQSQPTYPCYPQQRQQQGQPVGHNQVRRLWAGTSYRPA